MLDIATRPPATRSLAPLADHYRLPDELALAFECQLDGTPTNGFFRFGKDATCYGRTLGETCSHVNGEPLCDVSHYIRRKGESLQLPFDASSILNNLRYERYLQPAANRWLEQSWIKSSYYRLRPMLPASVRRQLQRIYLRDWQSIRFPQWPVDRSADHFLENLLLVTMQTLQIDRIPFIWFWPDGCTASAIMTHDVETPSGRDFCRRLMDINDAFGMKSSFQIVPEKRYAVPPDYLMEIRDRGCEINVQGLDHEGNLFGDRQAFLAAAQRINEYARSFGARGFRSPALYRNVDWFQHLDFSYDMSFPNVARLEAQRGGCCTVMPYLLPGGMTELPVTTTEDYTLFRILNDYSTELWKEQMSRVCDGHGLMTFIVHPDYVQDEPSQRVYKSLLEELLRLRFSRRVWITLPGEVDRWWRERMQMTLVPDGRTWKIEGPGSRRARIAYACREGDRLAYEIERSVSER